jgi:thiamine biosynthesis lipoprotein
LLLTLGISRDLARRSDGAFDPTIGPLVNLWRRARKTGELPSQEEIAAARKLVGWQKLVINPKTGMVSLRLPGMLLDLGGIAKGYACDEALRVLHEHGISIALIEMGGDIVVGDPPPGKKGWEIEIPGADPANNRITVADLAVSSSGDTEQFVEIGGKMYSHIVNPRTGLGLTDRMAVTVVATYGLQSDGLSTAISVMGEKKGRTLAATYPVEWVHVRKARD